LSTIDDKYQVVTVGNKGSWVQILPSEHCRPNCMNPDRALNQWMAGPEVTPGAWRAGDGRRPEAAQCLLPDTGG